jgi:hypothetical protein
VPTDGDIVVSESESQSFLKDEYLLIQNQYEDYDRRALTIKGWIGSGSAAALALSFTASSRFAFVIPIYVAIIAGIFWYLETKWKMFQYAYRDRIQLIEAYFRGEQRKPNPFQIYTAWFPAYSRVDFWSVGGRPFVCCLYVAIMLASLVSLVLLFRK